MSEAWYVKMIEIELKSNGAKNHLPKFATCNISAGNDDPTHSSVGHVFHLLS